MDLPDEKSIVKVSSMSDEDIADFLKKNALALKMEEVKTIPDKLGRDPTLTEIHIFNIQWSEHSSYKSSRKWLKLLPTSGKRVILGPTEDSGIVYLGTHEGERYGIIVSHESHNHPSQVVPYEGAATGVGGIIRDVLCMGGHVIATGDPLRFGNPTGKNKNRTRYIANAVIDGIAGYGNAVGVPNLAGDVYCNDSFDENCLVNVVCLGLVKENDLIHSYAPKNAEGYDVVVVGKATDTSGFGGAAFASVVLDEDQEDFNKGAVQVPDPFLKNVLIRATEQAFREVREKKLSVGFKDMGAGGIMCVTSELGSDAGYGMDLNLDNIHVDSSSLPPYIIACSETQERFCWVIPTEFTERLLEIYNNDFDLPQVAKGARASLIGKVTKEKSYKLTYQGRVVCDAPIDEVTKGVLYDREFSKPVVLTDEPLLDEPGDYNEILLELLSLPAIASKEKIFKHYDTEVQGNAVIRPGEADAGVLAPIPGSMLGVSLTVDCNPRYNRIDPYWGAVNAVCESVRNTIAAGAIPVAMTDCLNYGNPEKPEAFGAFVDGVKGIADATKGIRTLDTNEPIPIVSGNVSFYNESSKGVSVDSSPVIACVGSIDDYSNAITSAIKKPNSVVMLVGERKKELGGSAYYELHDELGAKIPKPDFDNERKMAQAVNSIIAKRLAYSCHDISDGGIAVALAEMCIQGGKGFTGKLDSTLRPDQALFSETGGYLLEIPEEKVSEVESMLGEVWFAKIGTTSDDPRFLLKVGDATIDVPMKDLDTAWRSGFVEAFK